MPFYEFSVSSSVTGTIVVEAKNMKEARRIAEESSVHAWEEYESEETFVEGRGRKVK